jgi:hypothetical protein
MGVKRIRARAVVACGLFVAAGLATVVVGGAEAQQPSPPTGTLQLVQRERDSRFHFIDVPPLRGARHPTSGDGFVITGAVRDQAGMRVGRLQAVFVLTNVSREQAQVTATFILSDGRVVASGAETRANVDDFAIVGGTGRYTGARGTLRVTDSRRSTAFLFTFLG